MAAAVAAADVVTSEDPGAVQPSWPILLPFAVVFAGLEEGETAADDVILCLLLDMLCGEDGEDSLCSLSEWGTKDSKSEENLQQVKYMNMS